MSALETRGLKTAIEEYVTRYNELLSSSIYFKKGVFEYYNADKIAKTLADNGFFDAKHTVTLCANEKTEIGTQKELGNITNDKELKKQFTAIKKQLEKTENVFFFLMTRLND